MKIQLKKLIASYDANVRFADNYGNIRELADNILAKGIIQPLIVEKDGESYSIISGHRRFAALNLLLSEGAIKESETVNCVVESYANELDRVAGKLLANDGTPITPNEWAAEIGRLSETGANVSEIAKALGKSEGYVNSLKKVWAAMDEAAKATIKSGKVSMSLAIVMTKESENPKLASLGVQIASVAKDVVLSKGETVSDNVLGKAVIQTTKTLIDKATNGQTMSGDAIGSDILANILNIKTSVKAANKARKDVLSESDVMPKRTLENFLESFIHKASKEQSELINELMLCYEQGFEIEKAIEQINKLKKQTL